MTWILYRALAFDYKGSGVLLLVFTCTAMLGIVDEILQGIHPQRTYGWKDMIIDTASGFIGVLMLMSLKKNSRKDWNWIRRLGHFKGLIAILIFGAATAVPMCIYLFDAQTAGDFVSVYPRWLLFANGLFLAISGTAGIFHWLFRQRSDRFAVNVEPDDLESLTAARLWVMCPLAILIVMQGLVMCVAVSGLTFS